MKEFRFRIFMILGVLALSAYLLYPTFADVQNTNKINQELSILTENIQSSNPTISEAQLNDMLLLREDSLMLADPSIRENREKRMKLGLDLQGGMYLVMEVNTAKLIEKLVKNPDDEFKVLLKAAAAEVAAPEADIEAADTPEIRSEKYDEFMGWTMLDDDYDDRTRRVFQHYPVFIPHWWHRYDPSTSRPAKLSAPASRPTPGGTRMPRLPGSDFAASVVNGVQDFSAGVIGSVTDFTSGVTQKTNPVPKSTSNGGYRSSGGSSCACACACAGCACACAGGGR